MKIRLFEKQPLSSASARETTVHMNLLSSPSYGSVSGPIREDFKGTVHAETNSSFCSNDSNRPRRRLSRGSFLKQTNFHINYRNFSESGPLVAAAAFSEHHWHKRLFSGCSLTGGSDLRTPTGQEVTWRSAFGVNFLWQNELSHFTRLCIITQDKSGIFVFNLTSSASFIHLM